LLRLALLATPIAFALACGGDDPQPAYDPNLTGPCQDLNQRCDSSGDCCGVLTCNANKVCTGGGCQSAGTFCTSSSQCCSTLSCSGGVCGGGTSCSGQGAACGGSSQCCGTLTCHSGYCQ